MVRNGRAISSASWGMTSNPTYRNGVMIITRSTPSQPVIAGVRLARSPRAVPGTKKASPTSRRLPTASRWANAANRMPR